MFYLIFIKTMRKVFLLAALLAVGGSVMTAQWSNDPMENNRITPIGVDIYDFDLGVSNNGNVFVTFTRPVGGNIRTLLQIVDTDGNMLFPEEGMTVSSETTLSWTLVGEMMFVDRDGNAIIAVTDCRNSAGDDVSYSLYKVSSTGEMLWGDKGIDLSSGESFYLVHNMQMVQIEDGSYVIAWAISDYSERTYIQLQRISQSGELLWDDEEVRLYNSSFNYEYPYLVNAGFNQVILVYVRGVGRHLAARKIDFDGTNVWSEDVYIYRGGFTIPPLWVIINVIPDQMGGAFVGWYDDRDWTNKESTFVSHVTSNGTLGFASGEEGEKVGYSEELRGFSPEMYFDKDANFLYVFWRETSQGQSYQQITGQKLRIPSGELMWGPDGLEILPLTQGLSISAYSVKRTGNGDMALFFTANTWDEENGYAKDVNNVMLLNQNGGYVWKDQKIEFATTVSMKSRLISTPLIDDIYWVTGWKDSRTLTGETSARDKIYLQRVNIDGTLGEFVSIKRTDIETIAIYSSEKMISIVNPENIYIESVQLFDINGRMLLDYVVKRDGDVQIPADINEHIAIVKVIGKNAVIETLKIFVK